MTGQELTDEDVFGAAPAGDLRAYASAMATKHGVSPDLLLRQMHQESRGRADAVSPKGARGPMQLMPGTAAQLGVDADNPYQNIEGGARYMRQQLDAFGGDERLALAAYNAGPGAVRKHGGIPPYAETQGYVKAIMGDAPAQHELSDAEVFGAPAAPVGGVGKLKKTVSAPAPTPVPNAFIDPMRGAWDSLKRDATSYHAASNSPDAGKGLPLATPLDRAGYKLAGSALALAGSPFVGLQHGVVSDPVAKLLDLIPTYGAPAKPGGMPRRLSSKDTHAQNVGIIDTSLMGLKAGGAPRPAMGKAPTLQELRTQNQAAWDAVDASGYRFPKPAVKAAAADIGKMVEDAGPELYSEAAKIARRISALAERGNLTPAQANRLRSQVGEKLLAPGSTEVSVGRDIKARIDALIDAGNAPELTNAREIHTRVKKLEAVTQRVDDAALNKAASGSGGNSNAVRQALKPLVKNRSAEKMRNATPDEAKALKRVVNGTPVQNLLRAGSAFDPFHSKLAALIQGGLGIKTGGLSAATIPLGMAATAGEKAISARNLQKLIDLIARGGTQPRAPVGYQPPLPTNLVSVRGLTGGSATLSPLHSSQTAAKRREPAR